ncbi:MAG TPA: glycosyltransferase, partial [Anaerolineales bacterium]|nr:glycosyltransferase [Anaerolineales bacterium]
SAELNPACPNAVIEALACGLPVVGFETGALSELVQGDAGRLASHGANPWRLQRPDIPSLADAAEEVLRDNERFRRAARARAESTFGLDAMVDRYLTVLLK